MSLHPERIEASHEGKPLFSDEKLGPDGTIAKAERERKCETAKTKGKTRFFWGMCKTCRFHAGWSMADGSERQNGAVLFFVIPSESRRNNDADER
jgi:hypothetical protein